MYGGGYYLHYCDYGDTGSVIKASKLSREQVSKFVSGFMEARLIEIPPYSPPANSRGGKLYLAFRQHADKLRGGWMELKGVIRS